jgi:hypothetical protein
MAAKSDCEAMPCSSQNVQGHTERHTGCAVHERYLTSVSANAADWTLND